MRFTATKLQAPALWNRSFTKISRGLFVRTFCAREFHDQGLVETFVQCNTSWNAQKGTIRGLHYQVPPSCEAKLVRCTAGSLWDVIVDLRPDSPTYLGHFGVELTAKIGGPCMFPRCLPTGFRLSRTAPRYFIR